MTNFEQDDAALNEVLGEVMGPEYADPVVVVDDRKHFGRFTRTSNEGTYDSAEAPKQEGVVATATEGAAQRARRIFGIDGSYSLIQAYDVDGEKVPDQFFIQHDQTGTYTTTRSVSGKYGLLQPDVLDLIEIAAPGVPIDRGFNWNEHKQIGLQTRLGKFVGPTGLTFEARGTILNDYTGTAALQLWLTSVCLACANQYAMSWTGAQYKWKLNHTANVEQRVGQLKVAFSRAEEQTRKQQGYLFAMNGVNITKDDVAKMVAAWLPKKKDKEGRATETLTRLSEERLVGAMDVYENADGARPGTLEGVVQMGTFMSSNWFTGPRAGLQGITGGFGKSFVQDMYKSVNNRFHEETSTTVEEAVRQHVLVLN